MTDRQARWTQIAFSALAVASGGYILISCLTGCTQDRTIEQDIVVCHTICGARPIEDFGSGSDWRNLTCRCGKIDPPPSPCSDAGAPRVAPTTW